MGLGGKSLFICIPYCILSSFYQRTILKCEYLREIEAKIAKALTRVLGTFAEPIYRKQIEISVSVSCPFNYPDIMAGGGW